MAARVAPLVQKLWVPVVLTVAIVAVTYACVGLSSSLEPTLIALLINLVIVVGLYIFAGNSGVLSFGHISFMAIAAYAWAILSIPVALKHVFLPNLPNLLANVDMPSVVAGLLGAALAAVVAFALALAVMRLSGIAASISTFAFLVVTQIVISNWDSITKGRTTMVGMPLDTTLEKVLVWAVVVVFIAYVFQQSRIGLRLRAAREDEVAARAIGVRIQRERTIAFALSAFVVGSAGPLFGGFVGAFTPASFYVDLTVLTLAMLVVGGVNSLTGAVAGTFVVSLASEFLRRIEGGVDLGSLHVALPVGLPQVGIGVLMLAILILRPKGLVGSREVPIPPPLQRWLERNQGNPVTSAGSAQAASEPSSDPAEAARADTG